MNTSARTTTIDHFSYWQYIWKIPVNRKLLWWGIGISIASFIVFKLLYPYPDFFGDSYSYIYAASEHLDINTWPIGYSKFLAGFHAITFSDMALVAVQYFLMQLAALHFLFTILYFFHLKGWTRTLLSAFLFINPLTLYLCNTINSDALFASLSLFWVVQLLWIVQRARVYQLFVQALLLFACFTIRNNAYYYPLVAVFAFLLSKQDIKWKLAGIIMPFLFIIPFVIHTRNEAYKITGIRQFSLFTGWQLANNALYIYDQIEVDSTDLPTAEAKVLNRYALQYFRRIKPELYREALEEYVGNFFIRQPEAPLKQYYGSHYTFKDEKSSMVNWAQASAVFEPFGKSIILQHPIAYTQYFVLPNVKHYFIPPLSHIGIYNYGIDEIDPKAQTWFHYKTNKIHCFSAGFQGSLLLFYIGVFLLLNVYYLWIGIRYAIRGGFNNYRNEEGASQLVILSFVAINFFFSIVSTVNILRYQYIPMIVLIGFSLVLQYTLERHHCNSPRSKPSRNTI